MVFCLADGEAVEGEIFEDDFFFFGGAPRSHDFKLYFGDLFIYWVIACILVIFFQWVGFLL